MKVIVLRTNGTKEEVEVPGGDKLFARLYKIAGCETFDCINLRDGRVMLVNDRGYETEMVTHGNVVVDNPGSPIHGQKAFHVENRCVKALYPVNVEATKLYHGICRPGTTHQIVGDVIIANDEDFA